MRVVATLCACALLVVAPASAGASGQRQLKRAKKLLEQFKDRAALRALQRARRTRGNSRRLRAQIWMYIGIANFNLLKRKRAARAFRRALKARRATKLPPTVSPKIRALWRSIEAKLPKAAKPATTPKKPTMLKKPIEHFDDPKGKPDPAQPNNASNNTANNASSNNAANTNANANSNTSDPALDGGRRDSGGGINWPAWISAGVALGAAGAAIGIGFAAKAEADKAADLERTYEAAEVNHAKASERALIANIMIGVAGAAAVTSVIFFIVRRNRGSSSEPVKSDGDPMQVTPGVSPVPGGVVLGVTGRVW